MNGLHVAGHSNLDKDTHHDRDISWRPPPNVNEWIVKKAEEKIFHFTALEDAGATVCLSANNSSAPTVSLEYKVNSGDWTSWDKSAVSLAKNDKMYIRAVDTNANGFADYYSVGWNKFVLNGGKVAAGGSIQYLLKKDGDLSSVPHSGFMNLFSSATNLVSPPDLPATSLNDYCYN